MLAIHLLSRVVQFMFHWKKLQNKMKMEKRLELLDKRAIV
jgi:hypothetical protein